MEKSGIRYVDGVRLKRAVIAGARFLIARRRHLDEINVFPVPDSDTGTNMASAARHLIDVLESVESSSAGSTAYIIADAVLMGGRGNSGAILAQFFQGFAESTDGLDRIEPRDFAVAAINAARAAREAVSEPREGTVLTVMQTWADALTAAAAKTTDYVEVFDIARSAAAIELARTPELLPELRSAHVVDAGAQGFLFLLDGVAELIREGWSTDHGDVVIDEPLDVHNSDHTTEITFRWCTECMLVGDGLDRDAIRSLLAGHGDSVVVAGSTRKVRVHIHTDQPEQIFEELEQLGTISREKADDMRQQWRHANRPESQIVAVVCDTGSDLPDGIIEQLNIHEIPFRIFFGDQQYIDKVSLTNRRFYDKLSSERDHPKTTQPTQTDLQRAYELVSSHYENVLSIHVPRRLSGTYQAAIRASERVSDRIKVLDSNSGSVGMGLIVLAAARSARAGNDLDTVVAHARRARESSVSFFSIDSTEYLVKGGRLSRGKGLLSRLLGVRIIFRVNDEGDVEVVSKLVGGKDTRPEMFRLIDESLPVGDRLTFAISHAAAPDAAAWYENEIKRRYDPVEILIGEFSPALGVHAGPKAIGVAVMGDIGLEQGATTLQA